VLQTVNLLLGISEHVERLSECQVTHDVESTKVIESYHVDLILRMFVNAFLELFHQLISVPKNQRLLLLQSAVRKSGREDLALTGVVHVASMEQAGRTIEGVAVPAPVFVRHGAGSAFAAMAVNLDTLSQR
jgi:hypothetical protein